MKKGFRSHLKMSCQGPDILSFLLKFILNRSKTPSSILRWLLLTMSKGIFFVCIYSYPAWSKNVSIRWKEIRGAVQYELLVERNGEKVVHKILASPHWQGSLDFGPYVYRLRAIDRVKRPGTWSESRPLIVMPPPPELIFPAPDAVIPSYTSHSGIQLKWKPLEGWKEYLVELKEKENTVFSTHLEGNEAEIPRLKMGQYLWSVKPIVEISEKFPKEIKNKKWEGSSSKTYKFYLVKKDLDSPRLQYPKGTLWLPRNGKINLKWEKVKGAEHYEVKIEKDLEKARTPAGAAREGVVRHFKTGNDQLVVSVADEGFYHWRVRALAGDESSGESVADFKLEKDLDSNVGGAGYIAASTMLAPYQYEHVSPSAGQEVSAESEAITSRISGEYWFLRNIAASAGLENTTFVVNRQGFNRWSYELGLKYNLKLDSSRYGWFFAPKIGLEGRDYFALLLSNSNDPTTLQSTKILAWGVIGGFDLRRQFSSRWSLGIKASYFVPFAVSGTREFRGIASDGSYRNMNLGAQGLYWLSRSWGLGMGAFLEQRSIGYEFSSTPSSSSEKVVMDAIYFFGSLIYSFGR